MSMLVAALKYASLGWPVFACEVMGKRPHPTLATNGFHDATIDETKIRSVWTSEPNANIGISCGPVVILDIDYKPEKGKRGDIELVELVREHGSIGWTRQVRTPSGGTHFYFSHPAEPRITRTIGKFAPCIDVLGWGGYAVAPPSRLGPDEPCKCSELDRAQFGCVCDAPRNVYEWVRDSAPLSTPSAWVEARMRECGREAAVSKPPVIRGKWRKNDVDIAMRAMLYVDKMPIAVSGAGGHDALWAVACVVVRGFDLPDALAIEVLRHYSQRCEPPWSERELEHKLRQAKSAEKPDRGSLLRERA